MKVAHGSGELEKDVKCVECPFETFHSFLLKDHIDRIHKKL